MAKGKKYSVAPRCSVLTLKGMAHAGAKIKASDLKCEDPDKMFERLIKAEKIVEYVPSDAEKARKEAKAKKERAEADKAKKDAEKAKKKAEKEEAEAKKAEKEAGKK